ncbi:MAG: PrsW family intramembrane metalloprotease [Chloroflexota bacterium]
MPLALSLLFGVIPMLFFAWLVYWLDRYEKEPRLLLGGVFAWGALVAAGGAYALNTLFGLGVFLYTSDQAAADLATGTLIAPFFEEGLKALAVFLVFLVARREFDSIVDGIVYAAIVALGFAATENTLYIYRDGFQTAGYSGLLAMSFVRVVLVGWQHPFYTAFTGIGLAAARLSPRSEVRLLAPAIGLVLAIFTHAMHNFLAVTLPGFGGFVLGTAIDWSGWSLMLLFALWALYREQRWLAEHLREEVGLGTISPAQYKTACSMLNQAIARFGALFNGRFRVTRRFYQVCAELAFKKHQRQALGEEGGNSPIIDRLRGELASLSPHALD